MGFINSALGQIKSAIVFDETGSSLPQVLQIANAMGEQSKLFCLLLPNIYVVSATVLKMLQESKRKSPPFDQQLSEQEIRYVLSAQTQEIYEALFKSIFPKELDGRIIIRCIWQRAAPLRDKDLAEKYFGGKGLPDNFESPPFLPMGDYASPPIRTVAGRRPKLSYIGPYPEDFKGILDGYYDVEIAGDEDRKVFIKPGDVIAGDGFLLVGIRSYINYAKQVKRATKDSFKKYIIRTYYGLQQPEPEIYIVGKVNETTFSDDQHFYHLDLYINYAGKTAEGKEIFFLAEIQKEELRIFSVNRRKERELKYLKQQLDDVVLFLPKDSVVVRVPVVVDECLNIFTFNNCVTEITNTSKKCLVPRYYNVLPETTDRPAVVQAALERCYNQFKIAVADYFKEPDLKFIDVDKLLNGETNQALHCFISVLERF
jgi:hypothetical protein